MASSVKLLDIRKQNKSAPVQKYRPFSGLDPQLISKLSIQKQAAFYRSRLDEEAARNARYAGKLKASVWRYEVSARKIHTINKRKVNTFAPFSMTRSAFQTINLTQRLFIVLVAATLLTALAINIQVVVVALLAVIMVFYFGNLLLTFWVSVQTLDHSKEIQISDDVVRSLADVDWPRYTILCPLYKETEVVQQFAAAMGALDYPVDKLQILFLTEADDEATREAIRAAQLPPHFEIVTVPEGQPRTKPRACNYGLLYATGTYLVIYDAEDIPDPLQLKKALLTFLGHDSRLGCVQAKLNFYNSRQNILTRLFTIEYSTWFEMTLPGLQEARFSLPLGGTSNHFKVRTLLKVGAWDAFNVTEDCDLGLRLSAHNLRTVILDSTTYEEANPNVKNWIRQRSRWIKGFFQTYLVHMRNPLRYLTELRLRDLFSLQFIVGGRTLVLLINPIMWVLLVIFVLFRPYVVPFYEALFPAPVLYMAVISMIMGNLLYVYVHFMGCLKRNQPGLVKWSLLLPLYWVLGSYAALKALGQLITKPHHWEKTIHGLHLHLNLSAVQNKTTQTAPVVKSQNGSTPTRTIPLKSEVVASPTLKPTYSASGNTNGHSATRSGKSASTHKTTKRSQQRSNDRWLKTTIFTACFLGLAATAYFFLTHQILLYKDSSSHLGIARLLFDNIRPGFAHLGGVWLPLPHLAMMPFTMVDYLWRTGLAGACVSMPSYVITALYIFLSIRRLTHNSRASFVGSLVFMLNPNVLYLQATPLTEPLAAATITAACYHLLAWIQDENPIHLLTTAAATFLASLSRYDGWALFIGFLTLIPIISLIKRRRRHDLEANTIVFAVLGSLGIVIWIVWCALILGDPLYWQRSEYSSQGQHAIMIQENRLYTYHDPVESVRAMIVLSTETIGPIMFALSITGLLILLARKRFSTESLASLTFLIPFAFYIFSLYSGQVSINLPQLVPPDAESQYFNARFGMIIVPPAAIYIGVLFAALSPKLIRVSSFSPMVKKYGFMALCTVGILSQSLVTTANGVIALQDGQFGRSCQPHQKIVDYLARNYSGGRILLDTFTNSSLYVMGPVAGVEFKNLVYEGTQVLWDQALHDPASVVDWIVLDPSNPNDKVSKAIDTRAPRFLVQYELVAEEADGARGLFRRRTLVATLEKPIAQYASIASEQCAGY